MQEKNKVKQNEALNKMQDWCSKQEKCVDDVEKKLKYWKLTSPEISCILKSLREDGFLNNHRYASSFVRDKFNLQKWGKKKIIQSLAFKRIEQHIIDKAINVINEEEYERCLKETLANKERSLKNESLLQKKAKLFRFASQRGFEADRIYPVLDELTRDNGQ